MAATFVASRYINTPSITMTVASLGSYAADAISASLGSTRTKSKDSSSGPEGFRTSDDLARVESPTARVEFEVGRFIAARTTARVSGWSAEMTPRKYPASCIRKASESSPAPNTIKRVNPSSAELRTSRSISRFLLIQCEIIPGTVICSASRAHHRPRDVRMQRTIHRSTRVVERNCSHHTAELNGAVSPSLRYSPRITVAAAINRAVLLACPVITIQDFENRGHSCGTSRFEKRPMGHDGVLPRRILGLADSKVPAASASRSGDR